MAIIAKVAVKYVCCQVYIRVLISVLFCPLFENGAVACDWAVVLHEQPRYAPAVA